MVLDLGNVSRLRELKMTETKLLVLSWLGPNLRRFHRDLCDTLCV